MQVWVVMKNVWDGGEGSRDSVATVFNSEEATNTGCARVNKEVENQLNGPRFSVEGPFEVLCVPGA